MCINGVNDMNAIEIRNLVKKFGEKVAVNELNMTVPVGSIYGFIGENGSGKSTTEKLICGLIRKNSGEIKHERFYNIINYLDSNDVLVLNNTKVIPARIYGIKESTNITEITLDDFNEQTENLTTNV